MRCVLGYRAADVVLCVTAKACGLDGDVDHDMCYVAAVKCDYVIFDTGTLSKFMIYGQDYQLRVVEMMIDTDKMNVMNINI